MGVRTPAEDAEVQVLKEELLRSAAELDDEVRINKARILLALLDEQEQVDFLHEVCTGVPRYIMDELRARVGDPHTIGPRWAVDALKASRGLFVVKAAGTLADRTPDTNPLHWTRRYDAHDPSVIAQRVRDIAEKPLPWDFVEVDRFSRDWTVLSVEGETVVLYEDRHSNRSPHHPEDGVKQVPLDQFRATLASSDNVRVAFRKDIGWPDQERPLVDGKDASVGS